MAEDSFCESCNTTFHRREHYERHVRTHTKEKPFTCSECQQAFGRVDSLSRHYTLMHVESIPHEPGKRKSDRRRVAQACKRCSSTKIRCNGERPCERCSQQGRECYYEPSQRRRHAQGPVGDGTKRNDNATTVAEDVPPSPKRARPNSQMSKPKTQALMASMSDCVDLIDSNKLSDQAPMDLGLSAPFDPALATLLDPTPQSYEITSMNSTVASDLECFNTSALTPSFGIAGSLDIDTWLDFSTDKGVFPPLMHMDLTLEAWNSLPDCNPLEDASKPVLFTAPAETSPIAQLYSRAHSPELDKDSVGPREYHPTSIEVDAQLIFPDMEKVDMSEIELEDLAHVEEIPQEVVSQIVEYTLHLERHGPYPHFLEMRIPPARVLNSWVQLYFEHFHPIFPFLHKPSFSRSSTHWMLFFAVAAIGAHFSRLKDAQLCARAMHELIRRQTNSLCEQRNHYGRELFVIQITILNQTGRMFAGERRSLEISEFLQALPATLGRRKGLFLHRSMDQKIADMSGSLTQKWQVWAHDEERRRTGFKIWLQDTYFDDLLDLSRVIKVEELQMSLPQSEERWSATTAQEWASSSYGSASPSLPTLERVIIENSWKSTWMKTGILGKQVLLQQLNTMMNCPASPGSPSFSDEQRLHAEDTILELLYLIEDEKSDSHISEYKAMIACQLLISSTLALRKSPTRNVTLVALKTIYNRMDDEAWSHLSAQWNSSRHQTRQALFWAARVLHIIRSHRCAHPATPIALLRAVLILWLYSSIVTRPSSGFERSPLGCSVVLGPKDMQGIGGPLGFQTEWSVVKLPGIGNLLTDQGRCKLLDETISLMQSLKCWAISASYAQLLIRLRGAENLLLQGQASETTISGQ